MLHQKPDDPLPLRQLIFLNRNDDIREWFLANKGHDHLDQMDLKSGREDVEDLDQTPETHIGRYPFFDRDVRDQSAGGKDSVREMRDEESVDDEEWQEAEPEGETQGLHSTRVIYVDNGDVSI